VQPQPKTANRCL